MRRLVIYLIAGVFVLALVLYMVAYTVRFTEVAVVTTFGKASESSTVGEGLHFKWPYPIQRVMTYDTRVRVFQSRQETQRTADEQQLVVQAFCTWRVKDPLAFFRRFSNAGERPIDHFREAESTLDSSLRTAMASVSKYRMSELFTIGGTSSRLAELEQDMLNHMKSTIENAGGTGGAGSAGGSFGIEIVSVGIARVQLPEGATAAVFERITAQQDKLAQAIQSQGEAEAAAIKSRAQAEADQIGVFAEARAASIRARGEIESAPFLARMNDAPELAVFIQQMDFVAKTMARRVTLVFSTALPGFAPFESNFLNGLQRGQVPPLGFPAEWYPPRPDTGAAPQGDRTPTSPPAGQTQPAGREGATPDVPAGAEGGQ